MITQVQETQRVPNRINPRRNSPRHILIKLTKIKHKEQILKATREKQQITYKGIPIRITANLSIETLQARKEWQDILKVMKENNLQPRLLYPARISFLLTDKQKLREFSTTKPALQQILKDLLQTGNTKRVYKLEPKTIKLMAMGSYLSIITLNINVLNAPTKRQRLAEWLQKQDPYICRLQETHLKTRDTYRLKVKGWKKIFHENRDQKNKQEQQYSYQIKQTLKQRL